VMPAAMVFAPILKFFNRNAPT